MDKVLIDCIILSVVITSILGVSAYGFGPELLKIYTEDAKVIQCGMEILLYTTVTYFLCGLMDLFPGALRGMGHSADHYAGNLLLFREKKSTPGYAAAGIE